VLYRIVHDEPALDGLPDELHPLVSRCLTKDPVARPSVSEVIEVIELCEEASEATHLVQPEEWLPDAVAADIAMRTAAPAPPMPPSPSTTPSTEWWRGAGDPPLQPPNPLPAVQPEPKPRLKLGKTIAVLIGGAFVAAWGFTAIGGLLDDRDSGSSSSGTSESPSSSSGSGGSDGRPDEEPKEKPDEKPTKRPDPKPVTYRDINVADHYYLHFADDPLKPQVGAKSGAELGYNSNNRSDSVLESSDGNVKFVLLDEAQKGSLKTCRNETRFTDRIPLDRVSPGSRICLQMLSGHVAAVTYRGRSARSDPSDYVTLDITLWRNAIEPEETALSIAAEIVADRCGGSGVPLAGGHTPIHHGDAPSELDDRAFNPRWNA